MLRTISPYLKQKLTECYNQTRIQLGEGPILDLACGMAGFTRQLAKVYSERRVRGIDTDSEVIAYARLENTQYSNLEFKVGNALGIVTCIHGLHHLELSTVITQAAQALGDGGIFWIHDFDRSRISNMYEEKTLDHIYKLRRSSSEEEEVLAEFERKGFFSSQERILHLTTFFSMMAAYTRDEVQTELINNGLVPIPEVENLPFFSLMGIKLPNIPVR